MKKTITFLESNFLTNPTIISLLICPILIFGIPYGIYGLTLSGGSSLGGVIILIFIFFAITIYFIDRIIVKKINTILISFGELLLFYCLSKELDFDLFGWFLSVFNIYL